MKLIPKKGGHGYISSYTVNISLKLAKSCGFVDEKGNCHNLEIVGNPCEKTITIKVVESQEQ
ncbi:MAG: hypothetical protein FWG63_05070 [Defluviitaleaceae bacterium]|nr:hypothetical protein [Defluviitaleaceae bacterium]